MCDSLPFLLESCRWICYTITRYNPTKTRSYWVDRRFPAWAIYQLYMPPWHSSDIHASMPPDSLLRENESSVRDLPLVKQN